MSIPVNDNFQNYSPKPLDAKYTKFVAGQAVPYSSVADVNNTIPYAYRSVGLTVLVSVGGVNKEFWYKNGKLNSNLVEKNPPVGGGAVTQAIFSGDGQTLEFEIPHGLTGIPNVVVTPGSEEAAQYSYIEVDSMNITIFFDVAPIEGEDNLLFYWQANL